MINLCIVGSGDVVRVRHAAILKDLSKQIKVKSIVSTRQDAVEAIEKELGYKIQRFDTVDDAIKQDISAALIAVTPSSTADVATHLLRLGIPLYIEQPLADDFITGAKLVEDIVDKQLPVVIGLNFQNQERYSHARSMVESCNHKDLTHVIVRDTLKRGDRTNMRTDDGLFNEHIVNIVSSIRAITGRQIEMVASCKKRIVGSISEYTIKGALEGGVYLEVQFCVANTWSEDRYSIVFKDDDLKINHVFNHETKKYTDTVEHWHGPDELKEVVTIKDAACGMRVCWEEFLDLIKTKAKEPSPTLLQALNDIQVREAVNLSRSKSVSIPIIKFI
ncbi:MAG TPA: Gfo/Idh/MocA family oxidoreductase [Patescibacteria group bacterium]|nr:Gfo/Idh/MocA family oxidoreductase [Patescibacteria group bacterium]